MGTKHTPGPWVKSAYGPWVSAPCLGDRICVHEPFTDGRDGPVLPRDEQEANAVLIAAAPELLEALILAVEDEPNACFADTARAVIAKAKGETK